ncbi:hypothetical protein CONPUDRAFT_145768 [Coniophora puteana RWD-64-598 SS2]|uniref:DUF6532 domain-containing protein n=1 Tax=Coniophora puteana (strain RWD-64-598) TaxID=741705 RepID=A0A5M3MHM1_CONPW|nr:uncharacterized protein CONPUDRAFT_145768 [Coniophora puteana RWD-64-598 SS2]EIW78603.1 hypothetical protein CONPUDRAFT_145768 [Coniophora puteana RWD-64-598 SS2]
MRRRISMTTGDAKTAIAGHVDTYYHFVDSDFDTRIHVANKALANRLVDRFGMCYENINSAVTYSEREGLYEHPILQKALNSAFFTNIRDTGVKYRKMFSPLSTPLLALLWTAIQCRIDEWRVDGKRQTIQFDRHEYGKHLQAHIDNMAKFDRVAKDAQSDIFDDIKNNLLRGARVHAGIPPNSDEDNDGPAASNPLADAEFAAAISRHCSRSRASSTFTGPESEDKV